eukprot:CAMPEP_0202067618 /NCGR_PEP_ID=MMETSP0963-20130614/54571_1 /ASSEMBLY_ACC=CAM_ASM_000494 /TAXON_ID=4773 /ORGANISM="Schizochytrium aggregatum, Strain ATCC28209" /LENGTH=92 /DNA_ID=CAMNT_0048634333 /DNA_START=195 /DNA_END=474 /DNA_ORIENTATION=-
MASNSRVSMFSASMRHRETLQGQPWDDELGKREIDTLQVDGHLTSNEQSVKPSICVPHARDMPRALSAAQGTIDDRAGTPTWIFNVALQHSE